MFLRILAATAFALTINPAVSIAGPKYVGEWFDASTNRSLGRSSIEFTGSNVITYCFKNECWRGVDLTPVKDGFQFGNRVKFVIKKSGKGYAAKRYSKMNGRWVLTETATFTR